jgi:predicted nucleic acid-binding protein
MSEQWVVNASPLILLAKVSHLNLLDQLSESFVVPEAVVAEILAGPLDDPARLFLEKELASTVAVSPHPLIVAWDLGAGETAFLSHALINPRYKAIVDDGAARRCAHTLSVPLAGTLAIILAARKKDLIPAATPVLQALLSHGFRIHETILRRALWETVGETWP